MSNAKTSYQHYTKADRTEISILLKRGYSHRDIADAMRRHHSSISREIKNNNVNCQYDPKKAHHKATVKRSKSKYQSMKIIKHLELENYITEKIKCHWTPEEIAGRWNKKKKKDKSGKIIIITAPSIYKYLYSAYGQYLCKYLPSKRYRVRRRKAQNKQKRQMIPNRVSIDERPKFINERKQFGHWEGDTLGRIRADTEVIAGLREKMSRYILIKKLPGLKYTVDGFNKMLNPHRNIFNSLTLDNGVENIKYKELNVDTYFCHPYSSWEKGGIENDFQRLRRFIPKGSSLLNYSNKKIFNFAEIMNNTPRKCLNWNTPKEVFNELCGLKNGSNIYPQCRT